MAGFFAGLQALMSSGVGQAIGSTALSSLSGQLNQSLSAHRNARLDYETWKKKFDYSYEMNSPLAQRRRLEAAGLNPALMYQGGTGAGLSTSIGQSSVSGQNVDTTAMASVMNQSKVADAEANKLNAEAEEIRRNTKEGNLTFPTRFEQIKDQAEVSEYERQIASVDAEFARSNAEEQLKALKKNIDILNQTYEDWKIRVNREKIKDDILVNVRIKNTKYAIPISIVEPFTQIISLDSQMKYMQGNLEHLQNLDLIAASQYNFGSWYEQNQVDLRQMGLDVERFNAETQRDWYQTQNQHFYDNLKYLYEQLDFKVKSKDWDKVMDIVNFIMSYVGMATGSGGSGRVIINTGN